MMEEDQCVLSWSCTCVHVCVCVMLLSFFSVPFLFQCTICVIVLVDVHVDAGLKNQTLTTHYNPFILHMATRGGTVGQEHVHSFSGFAEQN